MSNRSPKHSVLPEFSGRPGIPTRPFEVSSLRDAKVMVTTYSAVMSDMNVRALVPIIGLGQELDLEYGDKIYLEIYFDKLMQPVMGVVTYGNSWKTSKVSKRKTDGTTVQQQVYPNELEFITKDDLGAKLAQLEKWRTTIKESLEKSIAANNKRKDDKLISEEEWKIENTRLQNLQATFATVAFPYISNFGKFFESTIPSQRKLLKLYKMIAYTTKDFSTNLPGVIISPAPETRKPSFKLIQCVTSDLMLVDYCYQNTPCKIAIPWTTPVFEYKMENGRIEDKVNFDV